MKHLKIMPVIVFVTGLTLTTSALAQVGSVLQFKSAEVELLKKDGEIIDIVKTSSLPALPIPIVDKTADGQLYGIKLKNYDDPVYLNAYDVKSDVQKACPVGYAMVKGEGNNMVAGTHAGASSNTKGCIKQ